MSCLLPQVAARRWSAFGPAVAGIMLLLSGCGYTPVLMPTPHLYSSGQVNPFLDVEERLRSNKVEVLYATDRVPVNESNENREYGYGRSRAVYFGISEVEFGENISWDDLVKASLAVERSIDLPIALRQTREHGKFAPTPRDLLEEPGSKQAAETMIEEVKAEAAFKMLLKERLARTRVKEVYLFVHGFNNTFLDSVSTIAQLWHFFGRQGVPMAYTWPAGSKGVRAYMYDRESSEFTVYHLKQMFRLIASCPDVEKINVIGHSRGTDVVASALRELHLEIGATGKKTGEELKLGTVVLAAPDLDLDVVVQRMATARVGFVPERFAMYVCSEDKALGLSNWLFSGMSRLGQIRSNLFTKEELERLRKLERPQVIDARISNPGAFGHDYFHSNPAVSSDLILLMRYKFRPGAEFGRPLKSDKSGFWVIEDDYPNPEKVKAVVQP